VRIPDLRAAVRAVVVAGVAALCVIVAIQLSKSATRRAGTNYIDVPHYVSALPPHGTLCQSDLGFGDAAALRIFTGTRTLPGPGLRLAVQDNASGRTLATGRLAAGWTQGFITIPFGRSLGRTRAVRVCLTTAGPPEVVFGGENVAPVSAARVNDRPSDGRIRIEWLRSGSESWAALAPRIAGRVHEGKAGFFGPWLWIGILLLALATLAGTVVLVLRECGAARS
jgi:hypothetical protein